MRIWPGQPYPLGATWDGEGVNFALFSENATAVELCLFEHHDDAIESAKVMLREVTDLRVVSSELRAAELEGKLLARIRQFDFGAKDVDAITVTWPVDFLPS